MKFLRALATTLVAFLLPAGISPKVRRAASWIVRNGLLALVTLFVYNWSRDPEAMNTLVNCIEAGLVTIALAAFAQHVYTDIRFTDERPTSTPLRVGRDGVDDDPWLSEIIIAARIKTLGLIIVAMAIVVSGVWFGTYYIKTLPYS